ncbi:MAG: hypothetical protein ACKO1X_04875 [Acidimicrobiales bacterium]
MERSRRIKYAVATVPTQVVLAVVLAVAMARLAEGDSGEWSDLIGVLIGIVLGPSIGLALMIVLVLRALSTSTLKTIVAGASAGVATFAAVIMTLNATGSALAMLVVVTTLSTSAVWIVSGRTNYGMERDTR